MSTTNLTMTSGDDVIFSLLILEDSPGVDYTHTWENGRTETFEDKWPVRLTGSTADFAVTPRNSRRILINKAVGTGISIADAEYGRLDVELIATDTDALRGMYEYELQITDVAGNRTTPLSGNLAIRRDIIEPA
jgi:hypothetical protein